MKKILLFVLASTLWVAAYSQNILQELKVNPPVCYGSGKVERSYIPPPDDFLLKSVGPKSDIIVDYSSNFPANAKVAFEYAIGIYESILESQMPIHINVNWNSTFDQYTLASCGPETYYKNFKNTPFKEKYYAVAVAEKIAGEELNGESRFEIIANFSSNVDWYFGIDGQTPDDQYDFVTVVLHEITHGLGFTGFLYVSGNTGVYRYFSTGDISSFDMLVEDVTGKNLVDPSFYTNASTQLKNILESNSLFSNSPVAKSLNAGVRPRLYAPDDFENGSSVYHLNDNTYDRTSNALMTHAIGYAEAIHNPGSLTKGIMEDIGWTNLFLDVSPVKDKEVLAPLDFIAGIDSYYPIDTSSFIVIYSTDSFQITQDTFNLNKTNTNNVFAATLVPEAGTENIQYYVSVTDTKGRTRTRPSNFQDEFLEVHFGPDNSDPVITHNAIPFFLLKGEPLVLDADINDNLGIDTAFVSFTLNGISQEPFGLELSSGTTYQGSFGFNLNELEDGDVITYSITAIDASSNHNITVFPSNEPLQFRVEEIFDPVSYYINDFNESSSDFLLSDFSIYVPDSFSTGALNSPHPYPSPNEDNKDYSFFTFLKHPIIIRENGDMSFDEVVLVEPGGYDNYGVFQLWDYVIVEGSADFGESWYSLIDGYDSADKSVWSQNYRYDMVGQDSDTQGKEEWYFTRNINLLKSGNFSVGDTILVRFRLYSDPYAHGWGWAIDNLRIQYPTAISDTDSPSANTNIYPNPFENSFVVEINSKKILREIRIDVFDSYGRKLRSIVRSNTNVLNDKIDLSFFSTGMYLVNVSENGIPVYSKKMIKR